PAARPGSRAPPHRTRSRSGRSRRGSPRRGTPPPRSVPTPRRTWRSGATRTHRAPRNGPPQISQPPRAQPAPPLRASWPALRRRSPRTARPASELRARLSLPLPPAIVLVLVADHLLVEREPLVVQRVAELVALGAQVGLVVGIWQVLDRNLVG